MIELRNNQKSPGIDGDSVIALCSFILAGIGLPNCGLSISIVDDPEMISLNERYFGKKTTTDVISFPMEEEVSDGILLGDVVVCAPQAERVSVEMKTSPEYELSLYIVHGILHLIGETDDTPANRGRMQDRQESLVDAAAEAGTLVRLLDSH